MSPPPRPGATEADSNSSSIIATVQRGNTIRTYMTYNPPPTNNSTGDDPFSYSGKRRISEEDGDAASSTKNGSEGKGGKELYRRKEITSPATWPPPAHSTPSTCPSFPLAPSITQQTEIDPSQPPPNMQPHTRDYDDTTFIPILMVYYKRKVGSRGGYDEGSEYEKEGEEKRKKRCVGVGMMREGDGHGWEDEQDEDMDDGEEEGLMRRAEGDESDDAGEEDGDGNAVSAENGSETSSHTLVRSDSSHTLGSSLVGGTVVGSETSSHTLGCSEGSTASTRTLGRSEASSHTLGRSPITGSETSSHTLGRSEGSTTSTHTLGRSDTSSNTLARSSVGTSAIDCRDETDSDSASGSDSDDEGDMFKQSYEESCQK